MAEKQPSPASTPSATSRATQYGLVFLAGAAAALIGHRLFVDRTAARPMELQRSDGAPTPTKSVAASESRTSKPLPTRRIDLNKAERHELLQLPGVGPAMADGILAYRDARGPFQRVEELRSVRGIGATTLEKLKPWLTLDPVESDEPVRLARKASEPAKTLGGKKPALEEPIDLNKASAAELQQLPGIGPTLAQRIVDEREKKPFAKVDDLKRVSGIGPKRLEQVRRFVTVGE